MVYRGKPSRSCRECRRRKIKCDLREPGCIRCERTGRRCTGYRSQLDSMFIDETTHVISRQQRSGTRARHTGTFSNCGTSMLQQNLQGSPIRPARQLPPSVDDFALSYCYKHHILRSEPESRTLVNLDNPMFLTCMKAIGLASFSNSTHSAIAASEAQRLYIDAIHSINAALSSPDRINDYTLLSVTALAFFESMTGRDAHSLEDWKRHTEGMAALLKIRGERQIETSDGRHLFLTATGSLGANCLMLGMRLPSEIHELLDQANRCYGSKEDPLWQICSNMAYLTELYSDVKSGTLTDFATLLTRANELDERLAGSFNHAPRVWDFTVRSFIPPQDLDPEIAFPAKCHVYKNVLAAQQWNVMRIGRIICNLLIKSACAQRSCNDKPTGDNALRTATIEAYSLSAKASLVIQQMQEDILATVPQYLGMSGRDDGIPASQNLEHVLRVQMREAPVTVLRAANIEIMRLPIPRLGHAQQLLWSVGLVGRTVHVTHPTRPSICKMLRLIGKELGIPHAFAFAAALETDRMSNGESCTLLQSQ